VRPASTKAAALPPEVLAACDIAATGAAPEGPCIPTISVVRGAWYRIVWRAGAWQDFGDRRLLLHPSPDIVWGYVRPGELVAQHYYGAPIDVVWLVVGDNKPFCPCRFSRRGGMLRITPPDGRRIERRDPRRRRQRHPSAPSECQRA
jgi:hypothetical protein